MKYAIIPHNLVENIDFSSTAYNNQDELRWNNDNTKTIIKWYNETPPACEGLTVYTHAEILAVLNDPNSEWYKEISYTEAIESQESNSTAPFKT